MKHKILSLIILVFATLTVTGQQIETKKVFGGHQFLQNGKSLKFSEMESMMKSNTEAYQLIKSAKTNNGMAMVLGGVGGALIGWPLGTAMGGGEPNWTLAGIGAGLVVVSIPISSKANKKALKAVAIYNANLNATSSYFKPEFNLSLSSTGVGLVMSF